MTEIVKSGFMPDFCHLAEISNLFLKFVSLSLFRKRFFLKTCMWVEKFHLNVFPHLAFHFFAFIIAVEKELKHLIIQYGC